MRAAQSSGIESLELAVIAAPFEAQRPIAEQVVQLVHSPNGAWHEQASQSLEQRAARRATVRPIERHARGPKRRAKRAFLNRRVGHEQTKVARRSAVFHFAPDVSGDAPRLISSGVGLSQPDIGRQRRRGAPYRGAPYRRIEQLPGDNRSRRVALFFDELRAVPRPERASAARDFFLVPARNRHCANHAIGARKQRRQSHFKGRRNFAPVIENQSARPRKCAVGTRTQRKKRGRGFEIKRVQAFQFLIISDSPAFQLASQWIIAYWQSRQILAPEQGDQSGHFAQSIGVVGVEIEVFEPVFKSAQRFGKRPQAVESAPKLLARIRRVSARKIPVRSHQTRQNQGVSSILLGTRQVAPRTGSGVATQN